MKNNFFMSFIVLFLASFLFVGSCNAEFYFDIDTEDYTYVERHSYSKFNKFFGLFSNENLEAIKDYFDSNYPDNGGKPYVLFFACGDSNNLEKCNLILVQFSKDIARGILKSGGFRGFSLTDSEIFEELQYFDFNFESNDISISDNHDYSVSGLQFFNAVYYVFSFPLWTSRDIYWKDLFIFEDLASSQDFVSKTLYIIDDYSLLDSRYKSYFNYIPYEYNSYIYTLLDLVGLNTTKPSNIDSYIDYEVRYYFDGELDLGKTYKATGKVGDVINEYTDYSNDTYYLLDGDYSITLANEKENYLNIYFKSYKNYRIEYYFDDVLREDYIEYKKGKVGDVITEFTDYSDNDYKFYGENYSFTIYEDDNQNVFRIYYRSNKYGVGASYEQIDTRNSKIPFIFHYDMIKQFFSGINFNSFTQSEQLMITIFINVWFIGIFSFVCWLFLKIVYKIFQLF